MPISATGSRPAGPSGEAGFTLIELMVVITIIAIATAAVVLVFPDSRGHLTTEADRFAARAFAARDDAITQGRSISVLVTPSGYGFERRAHGRWDPAAEKPFLAASWDPGTEAQIIGEKSVRATFDSTGTVSSPVTVRLQRGGATVDVGIAGDGTVRVGR